MHRGGSGHLAHSPVEVRWAPCVSHGPTHFTDILDILSMCGGLCRRACSLARIKGCVVLLQSIMKLLRVPPLRAVLCVPKRSQTN